MRFRGLVAALALSLLASGHSVGARSGVGIQGPPPVSRQQEAAFKTGGYAAAAAITGSYVRTVEGTEAFPFSLDNLVSASPVIVIGSAVRSRGVVVPRGDVIRTHYVFSIESFLKWDIDTGDVDAITISVNGGRADLAGGRWAQEIVTDAVLPVNGQRYVLFLNPIPQRTFTRPDPLDTPDAAFWPVLGAHGIYRLGERVQPADTRLRSSGSPSMRFRGAEPDAFLTDVRESIQRALDDILMHRNRVPLSRLIKDPRAKGPVVVVQKDFASSADMVVPGGPQLEWMASIVKIALVAHVDEVLPQLRAPDQDWIVSTVRATIDTVIKQPPTESLAVGQSIEFQQDGGELTIDGRRVRAVVRYADPHATGNRYLLFVSRHSGQLHVYEPTSYLINPGGRLQSLCKGLGCRSPQSENGVELTEAIRRVTLGKAPLLPLLTVVKVR